MHTVLFLSTLLWYAVNRVNSQVVYVQPEQIHLAYGADPSQMTVSWVTQNVTLSEVEYGTTNLSLRSKPCKPTLFQDGGPLKRQMWIHEVTLQNLKPGMRYMYHVGSPLGWSEVFTFVAMRQGADWSPRLAVFGDMGNENSLALASLQEEAQRGGIDAVLHIGDFAYDMDTDNARVGDAFMNQIEPVAAYVPYMVCVGNHEHAYNFSNYKARFSMPGGDGENLFYSFNIGAAHIIAVSTEAYYFYDHDKYGGIGPALNQYNWLVQDLKEANKPAARAERPWIIVVGHRPMFCSSHDGPQQHCNNLYNNTVRTGFPGLSFLGLEHLFYEQGVDLQFYAHEHSYERLWPVYNLTVCNGTEAPYTDPPAPVHIITGSGGNEEGQTGFNKVPYPWSAFRSMDFGFTRLKVTNRTHLDLEQVSTHKNLGTTVIDRMTLVKHKHGAGIYNCGKT